MRRLTRMIAVESEGFLGGSKSVDFRYLFRITPRRLCPPSTIKRPRCIVIAAAVFAVWIVLYISGLYLHLIERSYSDFSYPLNADLVPRVDALLAGRVPDLVVINTYDYPYILDVAPCRDATGRPQAVRLLYLIKSAVHNRERRNAIRTTWGWQQRFSDVVVRRVFVLGVSSDPSDLAVVAEEHRRHGDIVQFNFVDAYYNNTVKTMLGLHWFAEKCTSAQHVMYVDDDMYVSTKNVLRFLRSPYDYPDYLKRDVMQSEAPSPASDAFLAGFTFDTSPIRFYFSKWYVSYDEYPYSRYPPYVTAGAYVMTNLTALRLYYASRYVEHFRFDDIYVSILAKKLNIEPFHVPNIRFWEKPYDKREYQYVISAHGFQPNELVNMWNEQRSLGNA